VKAIFACDKRELLRPAVACKEKGEGSNKSAYGIGCKWLIICAENLDKTS
jgi:hypothetical protein